jgi:hypothetical protein
MSSVDRSLARGAHRTAPDDHTLTTGGWFA